jgi:hypothetical protein
MFTIGLTMIVILLAAIVYLSVGLHQQSHSDDWNGLAKNFRLIYAGLMVCLLIAVYPLSPGRRAQAERLAQDFMTAASVGDYEAALNMTTGNWSGNWQGNSSQAVRNDLQNPNNRPVSWNLSGLGLDDWVRGTAVFPDGVELPVRIGFEWQWGKRRWYINEATFGKLRDTRLGFGMEIRFPPPGSVISIFTSPAIIAIIMGLFGLKWTESKRKK